MQVRERLISKSFFMINGHFLTEKPASTSHLQLYVGRFIFFKSGKHMAISFPKVFLQCELLGGK